MALGPRFAVLLLLMCAPAATEEPAVRLHLPSCSRMDQRVQRRKPLPPPPGYLSQKRITREFVQADLISVVKALAREMGCTVYIGLGVEGTVSLSFRDVPVYAALDMVLKMQENDIGYRVVDHHTLIVAARGKIDQIDKDIVRCYRPRTPTALVRQEVLLECAPAAKVIEFLQKQYQDVEFIPHPTMNGFYAVGKRSDILSIKNDVPNLDRPPGDSPAPVREFVHLKYGDLNEVKSLLAILVPDVQMNVDLGHNILVLEGAPETVEQAKELLDQLDKPLDQIVVECKVVDLSTAAQNHLGIKWDPPSVLHCQLSEDLVLGDAPASPGQVTFRPKLGRFEHSQLALHASGNFLNSQGQAQVFSAPRVAAKSGVESRIQIGDKFPLVRFDPQSGEFGESTVNLGTTVEVTPTLSPDGGFADCKIALCVTTLVELIDQQLPLTRRRHFEAEIPIKDGETLVLGGLLDAQDMEAVHTIPLFGDLPILGGLFRDHTADSQPVLMLLGSLHEVIPKASWKNL